MISDHGLGSPPLFQWGDENRTTDRDATSGSAPNGQRHTIPPIRTLHIAHSIAGGVASFLDEIAPYQNARWGEENIRFLVPQGSERHLATARSDQVATFTQVERRPKALLGFARAAMDEIRRFRPEIVHLHSTFAGAAVRPLLRHAGDDRPRIIYCPHGWAFSMESGVAAKCLFAAAERRLASRADSIIVNSRSEYDLALRFGLPERKLRLVRNGISWLPARRRKEQSRQIHLAFIGRHDRQKGLDILLDTLERFALPDLHVHVVGEGVVGRRSVGTVGARANVTSYGWLTRAQVAVLLRNIDALVMPSRWEAFGLSAIEAMRAGVPVIASNRGALPEVVQHGTGGYVFDLDDPDALGQLLSHLDRVELLRLGTTARQLWEREYLADRMNDRTRAVYEEALGRSAGDADAS